jgi:hypothetical protein
VQKPNDHKDLYFSLFYTAVHVFALINALVFWAILVPSGHAHVAGMDEVVIWGKSKSLRMHHQVEPSV